MTGCSDCSKDKMGNKKGLLSVHFFTIKFKLKEVTNNCLRMNAFVAAPRFEFKFTTGLHEVIVKMLSEDFRS